MKQRVRSGADLKYRNEWLLIGDDLRMPRADCRFTALRDYYLQLSFDKLMAPLSAEEAFQMLLGRPFKKLRALREQQVCPELLSNHMAYCMPALYITGCTVLCMFMGFVGGLSR